MNFKKSKYQETNKVDIDTNEDECGSPQHLQRLESTASSWISAKVLGAVHNGELSQSCKFIYYAICAVIILAIASMQGFMTRDNENNLISIQAAETCSSAFDLVERAWAESKLFGESIASGLTAIGLDFNGEDFHSLGISVAVQSVEAMTSFQFVKHLNNNGERRSYETQLRAEFNDSSFIIHAFEMFVEFPYNDTTITSYDPIIYSSNAESQFIIGFFPYPETPREDAITHAVSTGETSASAPVFLAGKTINPTGVLVFVPMYTANNESTHDFSEADDIFGFVNPVFKLDTLLDNALAALAIHDISLYLYDNGDYLGQYPNVNATIDDITDISINDQISHCSMTYGKTIDVGSRQWDITCCVQQKFVHQKRSYLPFFIFGLSMVISTTFNGLKFVVKKALMKAEAKIEASRATTRAVSMEPIEESVEC
eukprot:502070_1